ncbi:MAG: hypothetical protein FWB96_13205 [Defluviitaleaceae bacterium]|nr:hypothetical protein [Defluviitaleaceae bacterium]MCL2264187.1 hypothetical protein [Defluviitaleaceae bacterium]
MGEHMITGCGGDRDDEIKLYTRAVILGIIGVVVAFVFIDVNSDYHIISLFDIRHGIRIGDFVIQPGIAKVGSALVIFGLVCKEIEKTLPKLRSKISVYEEGVRGLSTNNEEFELKYSQISSVHSQHEHGTSVNINAHGNVYQVYTVRGSEIAAAINRQLEQLYQEYQERGK